MRSVGNSDIVARGITRNPRLDINNQLTPNVDNSRDIASAAAMRRESPSAAKRDKLFKLLDSTEFSPALAMYFLNVITNGEEANFYAVPSVDMLDRDDQRLVKEVEDSFLPLLPQLQKNRVDMQRLVVALNNGDRPGDDSDLFNSVANAIRTKYEESSGLTFERFDSAVARTLGSANDQPAVTKPLVTAM